MTSLTLIISAFPAPQEINAMFLAAFSTGSVSVILCGGGLGESEILHTHRVFS